MKKPFTLIEILVAMSILSVFLLGLMQFYSTTESVLSSGVDRSEMFERARVAMDMMANDLTCIYYSQSEGAQAFRSSSAGSDNGYFEAVTVRPEKLNPDAKTSIVAVKYEVGSSSGGGNSLYYSYDSKGDNFSVSGASFGNKTELVEGVTRFSVRTISEGNSLPALVVIRLELLDSKSLKRIKANSALKDTITKNPANVREFRRMIVIDRGQPKPTSKSGS
jgi:prepilin-type N-terminal cleavage/methylation domain-containing protein